MAKNMSLGFLNDGNPPKMWVERVTHEFVNDHHVFTSDKISGLFIAEKDPKKALGQIVPVIKQLIFLNLNQNVEVFLGADFREFERAHCSPSPSDDSPPIKDTFVVIQKAA